MECHLCFLLKDGMVILNFFWTEKTYFYWEWFGTLGTPNKKCFRMTALNFQRVYISITHCIRFVNSRDRTPNAPASFARTSTKKACPPYQCSPQCVGLHFLQLHTNYIYQMLVSNQIKVFLLEMRVPELLFATFRTTNTKTAWVLFSLSMSVYYKSTSCSTWGNVPFSTSNLVPFVRSARFSNLENYYWPFPKSQVICTILLGPKAKRYVHLISSD